MRFLYPSHLYWGLLVLVPVVLYLFRRKPKTVPVSTLLFFKALAREHQESAWLRRLKRLLSLLLTVLVIAGTVGALARLVISPAAGTLKSVVILLDRSASMASRDGAGHTRLEAARARIEERLSGLPAGVSVMVMVYDRRPAILLPLSLDRREVRRVLASIRVRPVQGEAARAFHLAKRLAALEPPAAIWHATDTPGPAPDEKDADLHGDQETAAPEVRLEYLDLRLPAPVNVGITAFKLRHLPLERGRFEAFVQVHGSGPERLEAKLEVRLDGKMVALRSMTLEPGGRQRMLIPFSVGEGKELNLKVKVDGDVLPLDDQVYARIPDIHPLKVLWVAESPDPFTRLALTTLGRGTDIEMYHSEPSAWSPEEPVDAVIFDHWLPDQWPDDRPVIVINPPGSAGPVRAVPLAGGGLPVEALRMTEERHPLLYGVATSRLSLTQTAVLEPGGSLEPLWIGPSGPILVAGEVSGQRVVAMAFSAELSEHLPLTASYPLLIGNALYWSVRPGAEADDRNYETGALVSLEGKTIAWSTPGPQGGGEVSIELQGQWTELNRIGLWRTDTGEAGSASLLSTKETALAALPIELAALTARVKSEGPPLRGDLAATFVWAVLILLIVESWLFHRRGVY